MLLDLLVDWSGQFAGIGRSDDNVTSNMIRVNTLVDRLQLGVAVAFCPYDRSARVEKASCSTADARYGSGVPATRSTDARLITQICRNFSIGKFHIQGSPDLNRHHGTATV